MNEKRGKSILYQKDYDLHLPSPIDLKDGELKEGDLITNMASKAVWPATQKDCDTIKPDTFENHKKFRKMVPII